MTNSHIPPSGVYMELLLKRSGGVGYYYFISGSFLFGHTLPLVYNIRHGTNPTPAALNNPS